MPTELASVEAERAAIGLLMNVSQIDGVEAARALLERSQLSAADFSTLPHVRVYTAIQVALAGGVPADPVVLFDAVRAFEPIAAAGGLGWLMKLQAEGNTQVSFSFPAFATKIREYAVRRKVVSEARAVIESAMSEGAQLSDIIGEASKRFNAITFRQDTFRTLSEVAEEMHREVESNQDGRTTPLIATGIQSLDRVIGGLAALPYIIGARPGVGKSAIAATMVDCMAQAGIKVGVFSLEDRAPWLAYRLASAHSGVSNHELRFRKLLPAQWVNYGEGYSAVKGYGGNVLIDDRRRLTAGDICQSSRNMIVNHGAKVILVDHLLEVKVDSRRENRTQQIEESLQQLRDITDYGVPVVVFTQLGRSADGKEVPDYSDFKESGAIEQIARGAIAVTRNGDRMTFHILKNTNGKPGRCEAEFFGAAAMVAAVESKRSKEYDRQG